MADTRGTDPVAEQEGTQGPVFRRHRHLEYRGYAFPWYVKLFWLGWAVFAVVYFVRWVIPAIP